MLKLALDNCSNRNTDKISVHSLSCVICIYSLRILLVMLVQVLHVSMVLTVLTWQICNLVISVYVYLVIPVINVKRVIVISSIITTLIETTTTAAETITIATISTKQRLR